MENTIKWLWLTDLGIYPNEITALLDVFENISDIYNAEDYSRASVSEATRNRLQAKSLKRAEKIYNVSKETDMTILTYDDINYPHSLRNIDEPPYVLYLRGKLLNWDRILPIGVVGTRRATDYGLAVTKKICSGLCRRGVTIVSGMALGIDTVAARTALDEGADTVAVLGCGADVVYPAQNRSLMAEIIENGTIITEYPPGTEPLARNFPRRNRIISGLSRGILVTEAPKKSGALITADYAINQGRDVFSIPGSIFKSNCEGTNMILNTCAKPVITAEDILSEYKYELGKMQVKSGKTRNIFKKAIDNKTNKEMILSLDDKKYRGLSEDEKNIISHLIESNLHIDEIKRKSGIETGKLAQLLSMLEFSGHITKMPGNNYKLNI